MHRTLLTLLVMAVAATPAPGQTTDFEGLLSGKTAPSSLKLKDLSPEWRRITVTTAGAKGGMGDMMKQLMPLMMMGAAGQDKGGGGKDMAEAMAGMSMLGGLFGGGGGDEAPVYFTQGRTHAIGGETFLVAYSLQKTSPDFMALMAESQKEGGKEPDFGKLAEKSKVSGDTEVSLTLLNVRAIGSISDIRPFDLAKAIEEGNKGGGLMDLFNMTQPEGDKAEPAVETVPVADVEVGLETARMAVTTDPQLTAKGNKVDVSTANGKLVLKGSVSSAQLKTRAENLARRALKDAGVTAQISNQITVRRK